MSERRALLPTLERVFAGPRESVLTVHEFLQALGERSYAFVIAALVVPCCIPTGIPLISTVVGVPMIVLLVEEFSGSRTALLPQFIERQGLPRGRLQAALGRMRRHIMWLEERIHPRHEGWVTGLPRRLLLTAWAIDIVILALPIPFDNLIPAWAILFFCLALLEDDGVMAMLGWLFTLLTAAWTIFLVMVGPYYLLKLIEALT